MNYSNIYYWLVCRLQGIFVCITSPFQKRVGFDGKSAGIVKSEYLSQYCFI